MDAGEVIIGVLFVAALIWGRVFWRPGYCPHCRERRSPLATVCPHCRELQG